MDFLIRGLTEEDAKLLCSWKYEGEYSVYNVPWEEAVKNHWSVADAEIRKSDFRAVTDETGEFLGFFRMTERKGGGVEIGLGMKPEYCGRGIGKDFVGVLTRYVLTNKPGALPFLEVRTFNVRAVKCYEKCGYRVVLRHHEGFPWGGDDYFRMEYQAAPEK